MIVCGSAGSKDAGEAKGGDDFSFSLNAKGVRWVGVSWNYEFGVKEYNRQSNELR